MEHFIQILDQIFNNSISALTTTEINFVVTFATISAITYLTIQGFLAISGKIEAPIKDTLFKLVSLTIIFTIATSGHWLSLIDSAITGLRNGLAPGPDPITMFKNVDKIMMIAVEHVKDGYSGYSDFPILINNYVCVILISLGVLCLLLSIGVTLLINIYMLKFLLAIAPIFIFCLSFQFIRQMFNNWLQLIFANILTYVFLSLLTYSIVDAIKNAVNLHGQMVEFYLSESITVLLIGLFSYILKGFFESVAQQIAAVSAEEVGNALGTDAGEKAAKMLGSGVVGAAQVAGMAASGIAGYGLGSAASGLGKATQAVGGKMAGAAAAGGHSLASQAVLRAVSRPLNSTGKGMEKYGESMKSTYSRSQPKIDYAAQAAKMARERRRRQEKRQ